MAEVPSETNLVEKVAEDRGNPICVCEVVCNLIDGGVESMLLNYFEHMDLSKYEMHIIAYAADSAECRRKFEKLGCMVHIIPPKRDGFLKSTSAMVETMRKIRPDVVHAHLTDWNGLAALCARRCHVPRIISHSHLSKRETPYFLHAILCALGKVCSTDLIACSDYAAENMYGKNWASSGKVIVLNNAILASRYRFDADARARMRKRIGCAEDVTLVGHVGRLTEQKNHPFLLRAFAEFHLKFDLNSRLLLFGRGENESAIVSLTKELGITDSVEFMGTTPEIASWYSAFDIFVLPSLYEGLPVSAVEAQANGVPTLLASTITEAVAYGNNVMFSGIEDSALWASRMGECLMLGRDDNPVVPEKFDIAAQAMRLEQMYAG